MDVSKPDRSARQLRGKGREQRTHLQEGLAAARGLVVPDDRDEA